MVRVRRWVAAGVASGVCFTAIACGGGGGGTAGTAPPAPTAAELGGSLYTAAPMPKLPDPETRGEPIVIPAVVQNDVRVQIPAQVDGLIELIATPVPPVPADAKADPDLIYHPRDTEMKHQLYRRLRENDMVAKGQEVARQDEQLVVVQIASSEKIIKANEEVVVENRKAEAAYIKQLDGYRNTKGTSTFEIFNLEATVARLKAEVIQTEREKVKAEGELLSAQAQLGRHFIKSRLNGRIVKLLKSPQEFAKAGEVIMEIQATDRVRVEGKLDVQYAGQVRRGMKATVEPARPVGPNSVANYHRQEVTSVAVTGHKGRPMVVSGGLDGNALVWDLTGTKVSHRLPHPPGVGVRSVACTGPQAAKQLAVTGGDDGKVRVWDLSNPDPTKIAKEPLFVFDEAHAAAVTVAALSPNGQVLATAAGRDVYVWSVADRKKLYALPGEHKDAVTSLGFTPQCTLVTAARDRSIRTWSLREKGAATVSVVSHRGGAVDVLGVSSDGAKVLFDKDPARIDVVSLGDERTVGTLQSPGGGARFASLAVFSPQDKLILTAGGDTDQKSELTIWDNPVAGGRGSERIRLMTPKGAAVTCAAFSPDADKRFVVVGTAEGGVHYWTTSAFEERGPAMTGEVVFVQQTDARSVTVRVEMENPTDQSGQGLQDRSLATIIIDPNAPAAPPALVPVAPAAGAGPRTDVRPAGGVPPQAGAIIPAGAVTAAAVPTGSPIAPAASAPPPVPPAAGPANVNIPILPDPSRK